MKCPKCERGMFEFMQGGVYACIYKDCPQSAWIANDSMPTPSEAKEILP